VAPYRLTIVTSQVLGFALALLVGVGVRPVPAQQGPDWDASRVLMSRAALEDLLARLEESAHSTAYSVALRNQATKEAAAVRERLEAGDFQTGDRIVLSVEGEPTLTDTVTVGPERVLTLPIVGDVPLTGVLHSELERHLTDAIGRFVRNPVVHARSLIRIAVLGEVGKPGFYTVPTETLVTDAVMLAGGPTKNAKLKAMRIVRGDDVAVWEGARLQEAIDEGRTLDQLSLVAGDRIEVPAHAGSIFSVGVLTAVEVLIGIPGTVYGLTHLP
jgi:protein involved in polysaccharide export with SLBB domain